jgi:hypothetical protein
MLLQIKAWLTKWATLIISGLVLLLLCSIFIAGCNHGKKLVKCPEVTTSTVIIHDTVTHTIVDTFPFYIVKRDSIVYRDTVHTIVDTAQILADYFATHYYTRHWQDSLLIATSEDAISENRFVDNKFTYKYIGPISITQNVHDNTITWNKYIYGGVDVPIKDFKYISLESFYAFPKGYIGISWSPQISGFGVKAGVKILQFKR